MAVTAQAKLAQASKSGVGCHPSPLPPWSAVSALVKPVRTAARPNASLDPWWQQPKKTPVRVLRPIGQFMLLAPLQDAQHKSSMGIPHSYLLFHILRNKRLAKRVLGVSDGSPGQHLLLGNSPLPAQQNFFAALLHSAGLALAHGQSQRSAPRHHTSG